MSGAWPTRIRIDVSSLAPGASMTALWSASSGGGSGQGYAEYRSKPAAGEAHQVRLRWGEPVELTGVRVVWSRRPRQVMAVALDQLGVAQTLHRVETSDATWFRAKAPVMASGVDLSQPADGGDDSQPDVLAIRALAVTVAAAVPTSVVLQCGDGRRERPTMPLHCDGDPNTFIDVSDVHHLHLSSERTGPVAAVQLDLARLAGAGAGGWVERWLSLPQLLHGPHGPLPCRRLLDTSRAGIVAGTIAVRLELEQPLLAASLRLDLPTPAPFVLAVTRLSLSGLAGVATRWRWARVVEPTPQAPPVPVDVEALGRRLRGAGHLPAERDLIPGGGVHYALGLGAPRCDGRAGVAADGGLVVPWGGVRDRCLHVGLGLDGVRLGEADGQPPARTLDRQAPILRLGWQHGDLRSAITALVDPTPVPTLDLLWTVRGRGDHRREASAVIGLALRDRLHPVPLELDWQLDRGVGLVGCRVDGSIAIALEGGWLRPVGSADGAELTLQRHLDLRSGQSATCRVRLPLVRVTSLPPAAAQDGARDRLGAQVAAALADACDFALPDPVLGAALQRLLIQALLFIDGAGKVAYGRFPSVHADEVFGLEEDWLLQGLAGWGLTEQALSAFRRTLLAPSHFDPQHPLRDLRACLAPWQADRLLRLAGLTWQEGLTGAERDLLEACGHWMTAQRARTADRIAQGEVLLPGLLPPWRYGGDLDWPTQAVHTDAIGSVGLACLAERLDSDALRQQAAHWRLAVQAALRRRDEAGRMCLHSGGGDPGDYHQLMACGFIAATDFFAPGDPEWQALRAQLLEEDRMILGLPRFGAWGGEASVDAHYGVGFLLQALRNGRRDTFWTGVAALLSLTMDRDVCTFREVSSLPWAGGADMSTTLPVARLSASEPCAGGVGAALMLLRHALVTEVPEANGRPGRRLRLLAGVPRVWWRGTPFHLTGAATMAGPVSLWVSGPAGAEQLRYDAPGAESVEVMTPAGRPILLPGGRHAVKLR